VAGQGGVKQEDKTLPQDRFAATLPRNSAVTAVVSAEQMALASRIPTWGGVLSCWILGERLDNTSY
jgi:hypothetical protein